jgi:hypothetical protein
MALGKIVAMNTNNTPLSIAEMAEAVHKDLLELPEFRVEEVFRYVAQIKVQHAPGQEERRKAAFARLAEMREKYKDRIKDTSPIRRADLYDRKMLR